MIGAVIGDIVGSRFEFHNHLSKDFEFLTQDCRFTDDTVMTCAVAKGLMDSKEDFSDLSEKAIAAMQQIGQQFPNCGYGARFINWMFSDNPQPYNRCGNGSAMRISPVGFVARDVDEAKKLSAAVTYISHNHPEGMKGAEATAVAIVMAREGKSKDEIRRAMEEYYDLSMTVEQYRDEWEGHGKEICQVSLPQALVCFLEGESFEDVIRNCISIGGDSDTIAAIAGGIADAYYGVPEDYWVKAERYLPWSLLQIVLDFQDWAKVKRLPSIKEVPTEEQDTGINERFRLYMREETKTFFECYLALINKILKFGSFKYMEWFVDEIDERPSLEDLGVGTYSTFEEFEHDIYILEDCGHSPWIDINVEGEDITVHLWEGVASGTNRGFFMSIDGPKGKTLAGLVNKLKEFADEQGWIQGEIP